MQKLPKFRTVRHCLDMHEPSIGDTLNLLGMIQEGQQEEITTEGLKACGLGNTGLWTVHERALAVAQYLSSNNQQQPDFQIGDDAKYSDFLAVDSDYPKDDAISLGDFGGDSWIMRPLLGSHAEAIERAIFNGELPESRGGWILGAMACQLFVNGDSDSHSELTDKKIGERIETFKTLPQSLFSSIMVTFLANLHKLDHFFSLEFTAEGLAFNPKKEVPVNYPARFPFSTTIDPILQAVFKPVKRSGDSDNLDMQPEL